MTDIITTADKLACARRELAMRRGRPATLHVMPNEALPGAL
jgi:hypothetical protein